MKHIIITFAILLVGLGVITAANAEWKHVNPQDLSVEYARLGQILVSVQDASIDVSFTEGRVQYYMDGDVEKCRWVSMGSSHKTFKDDYTTTPPVLDFSRMLGWVGQNIGPGFTERAEGLMATELGDLPFEYNDVQTICYTTNGVVPQ